MSIRHTGLIAAGAIIGVLAAADAQAQGSSSGQSRWGIAGSFSSPWTIPASIARVIAPNEEVHIDGIEYSVGFIRGRLTGGEWGVSFIRKTFKKGSTSFEQWETCFGGPTGGLPPCYPGQTLEVYNNATFPGVEVHWFIPFATIKNRVQVGLNLAGGGARPSGTVTRITDEYQNVPNPPNPPSIVLVHTEETADMSEDWGPFLPVFKVEAQAAIILGPSFKLKMGGGLSFPGAGFRIEGVFYPGAR